jgi:FkbM family methyltransferase
VGYFSLAAFSRYPNARVFAFEPMPVNFKQLTRYRDQNPRLDFTIVNKAVSGTTGTIRLHYDASDSFTTAASVLDNKHGSTIDVETTTLQQILSYNHLNRVDFLKLDCEGSEYPILYDAPPAVLDKISAIAIETHPGKGERENLQSLSSFLQTRGFKTATWRDIIWAWRSATNFTNE